MTNIFKRLCDDLRHFDWAQLSDLVTARAARTEAAVDSRAGQWPTIVYVVVCMSLGLLVLLTAEFSWLASKRATMSIGMQHYRGLFEEHRQAQQELTDLRIGVFNQRKANLLMQNFFVYSSPPLSLTFLLDTLDSLMSASGLVMFKLAPGSVEKIMELDTYRIDLGVMGTLPQLGAFVNSLEQVSLFVHVADLQVTENGHRSFVDQGRLTASLTLFITGSGSGRLPIAALTPGQEGKSAGGQLSAAGTGNPGAVSEGAGDENTGHESHLDFPRVGLIETARRRVVLLRDPQGELHRRTSSSMLNEGRQL